MKIKTTRPNRDVRHLTFAAIVLLLACLVVPAGSQGHPSPITVETVWRMQASGAENNIVLSQFVADNDEPLLSLQWGEQAASGWSWFPSWSLRLHVADPLGGDTHVITLDTVPTPRDGQTYEAVISVHLAGGLAAVRLTDLSAGQVIYSGGTAISIAAASFRAQAPGAVAGIAVQTHNARAGYEPVADRLAIGETTPTGTLFASRALARDAEATLRLNTPGRLPGQYRARITSAHRPEDSVDLGPIPIGDDGVGALNFHAASLPLGQADVTVTYTEGERTIVVQSQRISVGMADVRFTLDEFDYEAGAIRGKLFATSPAPLPGVTVHGTARFNRLPDGPELTVPVAGTSADKLLAEGGQPFEVAMPENPGIWQIQLTADAEPKVLVRGLAARDIFTRYPDEAAGPSIHDDVIARLRPGYEKVIDNWQSNRPYVAVTDQASRRILIMDPDVEDWNSPEAILWSWYPHINNGFAGVTYRWEKPDEVKIRLNDDGAFMLVTDSSGLAAMIPFPAGNERTWSRMVGGSPHSAELLPDGNIAIAASAGHWIRIYTASQGPDSAHYTEHHLEGAHGVQWDPEKELLWALGTHELHALKVSGTPTDPQLEHVLTSRLPTSGGHDLAPVYGDTDRLWVTSSSRVYQYIKSTNTWSDSYIGAEFIRNMGAVKGIGNQHAGRIVLTQAKGDLFAHATNTVHLFAPQETRTMQGAAFYKARVLHPDYQ